MLELGQVILGVRDLDAATDRMQSLGFSVLDGGVHPGLGTANRIIPLGRQYLELLGVVDPALAAAQWYGRALLARIAEGDRLVRWSLRTDRIDEVAGPLGLVPERRGAKRSAGSCRRCRDAGAFGQLVTTLGLLHEIGEHHERAEEQAPLRCGLATLKRRLLKGTTLLGLPLHEIATQGVIYPPDGPVAEYFHRPGSGGSGLLARRGDDSCRPPRHRELPERLHRGAHSEDSGNVAEVVARPRRTKDPHSYSGRRP